jgi:alkylhydroperoxidase family enzyme
MNTTDNMTAPLPPRPIMGAHMTDSERTACLAALRDSLVIMCANAGQDLAKHLLEQAHKLTSEELLIITRGSIQANRGARVLMVALGPQRLENAWSAESTMLDVKRAKRWLKNRY